MIDYNKMFIIAAEKMIEYMKDQDDCYIIAMELINGINLGIKVYFNPAKDGRERRIIVDFSGSKDLMREVRI